MRHNMNGHGGICSLHGGCVGLSGLIGLGGLVSHDGLGGLSSLGGLIGLVGLGALSGISSHTRVLPSGDEKSDGEGIYDGDTFQVEDVHTDHTDDLEHEREGDAATAVIPFAPKNPEDNLEDDGDDAKDESIGGVVCN